MNGCELGFLPLLGREFFTVRPWAFVEARLKGPDSTQKVRQSAWLEERLRVIHLPYNLKGERLNVADPDPVRRRQSIEHIFRTLRAAAQLPSVEKYVLHTVSLDHWDGEVRGDYESAVAGLSELMRRSEEYLKGPVCLENNRVYFLGENEDPARTRIFGDNPSEWRQLGRDVNHPMMRLCLDTSHAVTSAQLRPPAERDAVLRDFFSEPGFIDHVHWSANYPRDERGRADSHAALGTEETQPDWFHQRVAGLDASVTIEVPQEDKAQASLEYLRREGLWAPPE